VQQWDRKQECAPFLDWQTATAGLAPSQKRKHRRPSKSSVRHALRQQSAFARHRFKITLHFFCGSPWAGARLVDGMSVRCGLGAGTNTDVFFRMAALLNSRLDELTMPIMTSGAALALSSAAIGSYVSLGFHCMYMAITPTTCGTAIDVPCRTNVFVVDLGSEKADKISNPGLPTEAQQRVSLPYDQHRGPLALINNTLDSSTYACRSTQPP
jgi:hypothetical protein